MFKTLGRDILKHRILKVLKLYNAYRTLNCEQKIHYFTLVHKINNIIWGAKHPQALSSHRIAPKNYRKLNFYIILTVSLFTTTEIREISVYVKLSIVNIFDFFFQVRNYIKSNKNSAR